MDRIQADVTTLMEQAPKTVHGYLSAAVKTIDEAFGEGYAERNPALVSAFVQACAIDFATAVAAGVVQDLGVLFRETWDMC